jgi:hypothetical protein
MNSIGRARRYNRGHKRAAYLIAALGALGFALSLGGGPAASAGILSADPTPLAANSFYRSSGPLLYPGFTLENFFLDGFLNIVEQTTVDEVILTFDALLTGTITDHSNGATLSRLDIGQATIRRPLDASTARLTFSAAGARTSPSPESLGVFAVTPLSPGLVAVESSFDMHLELSFGGGPFVGSSNGPAHVELLAMPEPGTLGGAVMPGLALAGRARRSRRQKVVALLA